MSGSAAVENPPWGRATDRTGLRADYREGRSVSVWQADRELSGTGAVGRFEREPATTRTYHQTGEFDVALLVGGSGASDGAQPPGMAQPVRPPDDEAGRKIAKVAMARKLAVRLYWMMRKEWDFGRLTKFGSHAGKPGTGDGVK